MSQNHTPSRPGTRVAVTIIATCVLAASLLTLRHQRFDLMYQMTRMHTQMGKLHHALWSLQIDLSEESNQITNLNDPEHGANESPSRLTLFQQDSS